MAARTTTTFVALRSAAATTTDRTSKTPLHLRSESISIYRSRVYLLQSNTLGKGPSLIRSHLAARTIGHRLAACFDKLVFYASKVVAVCDCEQPYLIRVGGERGEHKRHIPDISTINRVLAVVSRNTVDL